MSNILRRSKSWRFPFNEWKWVLFDETTKQLLCRNFNTPFVPVWHVESLTKLLNLQIPNKCAVNWFDCRIASDFNWNRLLFNQSIFNFSIKRTTCQLIKKSFNQTSIFFILTYWAYSFRIGSIDIRVKQIKNLELVKKARFLSGIF